MDAADADVGARLLEYTLSTPYDLTTLSLVTTAGIKLDPSTLNGVTNPASIRFSSNGKRIFGNLEGKNIEGMMYGNLYGNKQKDKK